MSSTRGRSVAPRPIYSRSPQRVAGGYQRARAVAGTRIQTSRSPSLANNQFRGYLNYTPKMTNIGERNVRGMNQYSKYDRATKASIFTKKTMTKKEAIDYFDASKASNLEHALPIPNSLGLANTLNFKKIINQNTFTANGNANYYIFQFTPTQCFAVSYDMAATPAVSQLTFHTFDDLNTASPTNIRNSRATIGLYNLTNSTSIGGAVTIFSVPNSLEWEFDASSVNPSVSVQFQNEIKQILDSNPRSKSMSASMFVGNNNNNKTSLIAASMSKLEDWGLYSDLTTVKATRQAALINGANNFTHTTVIIRLESTSIANNYNFICNYQYSTRFPQNSILSSIVKQPPAPDARKVELASKVLSGDGSHSLPSSMM